MTDPLKLHTANITLFVLSGETASGIKIEQDVEVAKAALKP
jgi:hypothetical protein